MSDIGTMRNIRSTFARFLSNESGATAIEYGLLITILATGMVAGADGFALVITNLWDSIAAKM